MTSDRWMPKPRVDKVGMVHKPLFSADLGGVVPVSDLMEALAPAAEDPGALLYVEYLHEYQRHYWTVCYFNDQSDYYSI